MKKKTIVNTAEEQSRKEDMYRADKAKAAAQTYSQLVSEGKIAAANAFMAEALTEQKSLGRMDAFDNLFKIPTRAERQSRIKNKPKVIETPYYFESTGVTKEIERLTLPSGAITLVCAPPSHGKTAFLQNLALHVAQNDMDGSVLYFTFEGSRDEVEIQFENRYVGKRLSADNLRSITAYLCEGENRFAKGGLNTFIRGAKEFAEKLLYTGKLRVYEEDCDSAKLIRVIRHICSQTKVKAVFIDSIQGLRINGFNGCPRHEELGEISRALLHLAISLRLPVIVTASLNRETKGPINMSLQNIAESTSPGWAANKIILLWNSLFKGESKEGYSYLKDWTKRTKVTLGYGGAIYALLAKNRGGKANTEAVFTFKGNEGVITQQKPTLRQVAEAECKSRGISEADIDIDDSPF